MRGMTAITTINLTRIQIADITMDDTIVRTATLRRMARSKTVIRLVIDIDEISSESH